MKKIKKQPIFSEDMTPCHVVMINDHGLSSCFDSCDAVIKDHQVFAYKKQRGKIQMLPVRDTEFFQNNDVFDEYSDLQMLLHFEVDGKWGLFSTKTGAIVIEPVWAFIARVTTEYLHVISTIDNQEIEALNDTVESEEFDFVTAIERAIAETNQDLSERDLVASDDWEPDKEFKSTRDFDLAELLGIATILPLFDEKGELNFSDYYEYLEHLNYGGCKQGVIDRQNRVVIPVEYDYLREIVIDRTNYFLVQKDRQMGLLTAANEFIIPLVWDDMGIIPDLYAKDEKMIIVSRDQRFGVIDLDSREIIPLGYDNIEMARIGGVVYFKVTADGKEGLVNRKNEPLIPIKWDQLMPVSFSNDRIDEATLWEGALEGMICFEKAPEFETLADAMLAEGSNTFKFGIYDQQFRMVCPAELDSYQIVGNAYKMAHCIRIHSYVLIAKGDHYGVLIDGEQLVSRPVLDYDVALELIRQQQRSTYINDFIAEMKEEAYKIRVSFDLPDQEGNKIIVEPVEMEWEGEKVTFGGHRSLLPKENLSLMAEFITDVLEDLQEVALANWAKGMAVLIEKEQYQDLVTMLDEMVSRLAVRES